MLPESKISLYKGRSVSQCIEASFDFMRTCRRVCIRAACVSLYPVSLVMGIMAVCFRQLDESSELEDRLLSWSDNHPVLFYVLLALGTWMSLSMVFSLLIAYEEKGPTIERFSRHDLWPYMLQCLRRSWWIALIISFIVSFFIHRTTALLVLLGLLLTVIFSTLPSVVLIGRHPLPQAFFKSGRYGFLSFFHSLFTMGFTLFFGLMMILSFVMPASFLSYVCFEVLGFELSDRPSMLLNILGAIFISLLYFAFFVVLSMVFMASAYHYGSVSERVDDASLSSDIDHFDQL